MRKNMTLSDLETGMVVVLNNGVSHLVFGHRIVSEYGFVWLKDYTQTLEHSDKWVSADISEDYNINEVYSINTQLHHKDQILEIKPENLIWKRYPNKEIFEQIDKLEAELKSLKEMVR